MQEQERIMREEIQKMKDIEQSKNCNCHTLNKKINFQIQRVYDDDFHFCCKKCCECQWEKLHDNVIGWD